MRKGFKLTNEHLSNLYNQGYQGFASRGNAETASDRELTARSVRRRGLGAPGLTVTHRDQDSAMYSPCDHDSCEATHHQATYRDRQGVPVAEAHWSQSGYTKPMVNGMYADRTRGITHALAVGHIAAHLDKVGVRPDNYLSAHSQKLVAHGFDLKGAGRDNKLKEYLARRSSRPIAKGYKLTEERRQELAQKHDGFMRPKTPDPDTVRIYTQHVATHKDGPPGMSVDHPADWALDECEHKGIGCTSPGHNLVYRDKGGSPIACAHAQRHSDGTQTIHMMGSDRRRGIANALAVGHIASHVQKMSSGEVHPGHTLSHYSQKLTAHAFDHQNRGTDSKLTQYLARRSARVAKGYKMTPEAGQGALDSVGAVHNDIYEADDWARDELSRVPKGKPGLSIHRHKDAIGGGYRPASWDHTQGMHTVAYRDKKGDAVTAATITTHHNSSYHRRASGIKWVRQNPPSVGHMVSDRSRGAIHALGTAHVARVLDRLGAGHATSLSDHSQRMVAHSLEDPVKTSRVLDYLKQRQARVQKGHFFHGTLEAKPKDLEHNWQTSPPTYSHGPSGGNNPRGLHAGTVRAALDRMKDHCYSYRNYSYDEKEEGGFRPHKHYLVRVKPRLKAPQGSFAEPARDNHDNWDGSAIYRNNFEHPGSRSIRAAPGDAKLGKRMALVPNSLVHDHNTRAGENMCDTRCVHERAVRAIARTLD